MSEKYQSTGRPPGNYNQHQPNGKFGKGKQYNDEPNKAKDILKNEIVQNKLNGKKGNPSAQRLAELHKIDLVQNDIIDEEVLITQLDALRDIADEFPQVEKLLKEHFGHGLSVTVEAFKKSDVIGEHNSDTAFGDSAPNTGIISLNSKSEAFKADLENLVNMQGKLGKLRFGVPTTTSSDIRHTTVHEFGHIMDYVLAKKLGDRRSEIRSEVYQIAMAKSGIKELPKNISVYANAPGGAELFAECIADAYLNGDKANQFSKEVYAWCKRQLS